MFESASLKLTVWYMTIIMALSLFFSVLLYWGLTNELGRGLNRQVGEFRGKVVVPLDMAILEAVREQQLVESKRKIRNDLIISNISILLLAGVGSYYFARKTLEPIEEAHGAQSRFTADASHELRTPLTAMRSEIEVALRDTKLSLTDAKMLLTSNLEEINKLQSLSESLLALARFDRDEMNSFTQVDLAGIAAQVLADCKKQLVKKDIVIKTDLQLAHCDGNAAALKQLIYILLENAIKYSREKGEIVVSTGVKNNQAVITIIDTGIGIKESDLPHIFERFYRGDRSRTKQQVDGYGLGLSIAKKIVELHRGRIEAKSKITKGTTFTVIIPHN